jgi:tetratricopeptide (TPR) repeat protein
VERPELKVVETRDRRGLDPRARALLIAGALAVAVASALWTGADAAREPLPAREIAEQALRTALERGSSDDQVRAALVSVREILGRRPLDSATRVTYADLLLALSRRLEDTAAAAAHASRAASLAPVTVPVVRRAAIVLVRSGRSKEAAALTREMFAYAPDSAAELLLQLEPMLYPSEVAASLPDDAEAWLAWAHRLRLEGRLDASHEVVLEVQRRWPDDLESLRFVAARAVRDEDWGRLAELIPDDRVFPERPEAAPAITYRARLRIHRGELESARKDLDAALRLDGDSHLVQILVGEALEAMGEFDEARRHWNRALYSLPPDDVVTRRNVLAKLARLEDRHGKAADALRLWEALLRIDANHAEAARRVEALTSLDR